MYTNPVGGYATESDRKYNCELAVLLITSCIDVPLRIVEPSTSEAGKDDMACEVRLSEACQRLRDEIYG